MKQKKIFGGMLCLMLLGVFAMSSCVQDDMYELYDDGFESGFVRKKKSKDYGNWPDPCGVNYPTSSANVPSAIDWIKTDVHTNPNPYPGECFTYALSNFSGNIGLIQMREKIGRAVFNNAPNWEVQYYNSVKDVCGAGLPTVYDESDPDHNWYDYEKELIKEHVGAEMMSDYDKEIFMRDHYNVYENLSHYRMIVMIKEPDGKGGYSYHSGILRKMDTRNVYIHDQYGKETKYGRTYVQCFYK